MVIERDLTTLPLRGKEGFKGKLRSWFPLEKKRKKERKKMKYIQIQKHWFCQTQLVWQVSVERKKRYLALNPQEVQPVRWLAEKPESTSTAHPLVGLLRKHIPTARIEKIWWDPRTHETWLPLSNLQGTWYLWVEGAGKDRQVHLLSPDRMDLLRFGEKGTFTKKKAYEGVFPEPSESHFQNVYAQWIEAALQTPEEKEEKASEEEQPSGLETNIPGYQRSAKDQLKRKLRTVRKSIARLHHQLPEDPVQLLAEAKWLQMYGARIPAEAAEIVLLPEETGEESNRVITLDPDKSLGAQIEGRFKAVKKGKRATEVATRYLDSAEKEAQGLEAALATLKGDPLPWEAVERILTRYQLTPPQPRSVSAAVEKESLPYRVFENEHQVSFLIGKSPSENDVMTKAAQANDYWFHVVGTTGSHVIVPLRTLPGRQMTEDLKRQAGIYAVHYSKVRRGREAEVYCTQRRYLRKKKGLPAGLWLIEKSETLWIRYEEAELATLLQWAV